MVVRSGRRQSILHMSQRSILCSSNGLWHTWQWASSLGGECGVLAGRELDGGTGGRAMWKWDWIEVISCVHVGKVRRTHAFFCCLSCLGGIDRSNMASFFGVCVCCPCPKIESSWVEHKALNCWLGEWRKVGAVKKGVSLISRGLQGKTRGAIPFVIRSTGVIVAKVEVRRNVGSGLDSESEKWELVVGSIWYLTDFEKVYRSSLAIWMYWACSQWAVRQGQAAL